MFIVYAPTNLRHGIEVVSDKLGLVVLVSGRRATRSS